MPAMMRPKSGVAQKAAMLAAKVGSMLHVVGVGRGADDVEGGPKGGRTAAEVAAGGARQSKATMMVVVGAQERPRRGSLEFQAVSG